MILKTLKYKKANMPVIKSIQIFTVIDAAERKAFFERTKRFRMMLQAEIGTINNC